MQEALARAWERSEPVGSLEAWVTAVATNLMRSGWRRARAERRARERARSKAQAPAPSEDAVDVRRALLKLPPRQREATVLRYYLGLDVSEVATAMRVSEGTVKTTLHRARAALARALGDQEEEPSDAER